MSSPDAVGKLIWLPLLWLSVSALAAPEAVPGGHLVAGYDDEQLLQAYANRGSETGWPASPDWTESGLRACDWGQAGSVWFMSPHAIDPAGDTPVIRRTCRISANVHVFVPLVTFVFANLQRVACDGVRAETQRNLTELARVRAVVTVDGVSVSERDRRFVTPRVCFHYGPHGGSFLENTAAIGGSYVVLRPLPPGIHRVSFRNTDKRPPIEYMLVVH